MVEWWFWGVTDVVRRIVLLPGLEGTGRLFDEFVTELPAGVEATVETYPTDQFLSYAGLQEMVTRSLPAEEPFVLLGESYSAPLAVRIAATKPTKLAGLILSSGFVYRPVGEWTALAEALAGPWIFRLNPPRLIAEYFAIGMDAPRALVHKGIEVWRSVSPEVISGRVREAMTCDARADLARTTVPILDLRGEDDHLLADACVTEMKRIRPDMSVVRVKASHMVLQRAAPQGARIVAEFMRGLNV
jgi:pimeloyl-ACP methyl ester carboxylesterase